MGGAALGLAFDPATLTLQTVVVLCVFAFLAGFVDAVVGGGGLIQIPAMFVMLPLLPAATILGTNKFAAVWGTASAMTQYARKVPIPWRAVVPAGVAAALFSFFGAQIVSRLGNTELKPLILVMMVAVLAYTLWKKDFGTLHAPRLTGFRQIWIGTALGTVLGFYDGFFGPGTGSFLIFAFVGLFGFSFLAASASAKVINTVTNLAALVSFAVGGHIVYAIAAPMAVSNIAGSLLGSGLAIKRGSGFVRALFIVVVAALIARFGWDISHHHRP